MKIGFVGSANTTINCRPDKTFRLASYSEKRVLETIKSNLECIKDTITFCIDNDLLFYRIADFIPFFSHKIAIPWETIGNYYSDLFITIGKMIKESNMRIGMHPGQYTVINSPKEEVVNNSLKEIEGNAWILDKMHLDNTAKIQIHVGGIYGDKEKSKERFIANFEKVPLNARKRLVIENDDRMFDLRDCIDISTQINIPIVFDVFHHSLKNTNESIIEVYSIQLINTTLKSKGFNLTTKLPDLNHAYIIKLLLSLEIINPDTEKQLTKLRKKRNKLTHSPEAYKELREKDLFDLVTEAQNLTITLYKQLHNM